MQRCVTPNCPLPSSLPREYEDFTSSMGRPKTGPMGPCFVAGGGEGGACLDCGTEASAVGPAFEAVMPRVSPLSPESRPLEQQFPIVALKGERRGEERKEVKAQGGRENLRGFSIFFFSVCVVLLFLL